MSSKIELLAIPAEATKKKAAKLWAAFYCGLSSKYQDSFVNSGLGAGAVMVIFNSGFCSSWSISI